MRPLLLSMLVALTASSCTPLPTRDVRLDRRGLPPVAQPIGSASDTPGAVPAAEADLKGAWFNRQAVRDADLEVGGRVPWLVPVLGLWIRDDGTYDLLYQAHWGSRADDSRRRVIDVRESGQFSLAVGRLSLEPDATRRIEICGSNRERQTLSNDPRSYTARIDGGFLNLVGRCAAYQVESICRESRAVWFSLRSVSMDFPDDVPEP